MKTSPPPLPRWQTRVVEHALTTRRVLLLEGPRQCGKTTLSRALKTPESTYLTLDDNTLLQAAQSDPGGFVKHGDSLLIIDEIQRAPELLSAIKQNVDDNPLPGRFLLTGSANINALSSTRESLAGRVRKIRLRPLSMGELLSRPAQFLSAAFEGQFTPCTTEVDTGFFDKDACLRAAMHGGFPEPVKLADPVEQRQWHRDYVAALLERDLREVARIRDIDAMRRLVEVLAAWSSRFIDISTLCSQLGISRPTVESYIAALTALYLFERVRPWQSSDYDRAGKQDKLFMADTGLMTGILGWTFDSVRLNGDLNGKLMETFVFQQLSAHIDANAQPHTLWHYRDREKREIDFVIERDDGALLTVEVKAGAAVSSDAFRHIKWFKTHLAKERDVKSIVLYTGEHVLSFGDNSWAVPMSCLWSAHDS